MNSLYSVEKYTASDITTRMLEEICQFRARVWQDEDPQSNMTLDHLDISENAIHYLVRVNALEDELEKGERGDGTIIASARMTIHRSIEDDYRDVNLWRNMNIELPLPFCDLGRLVVSKECRGRGIAHFLNVTRVFDAKNMGANALISTASVGNMRLLKKIGFVEIGQEVVFEDRPNTIFYALQFDIK